MLPDAGYLYACDRKWWDYHLDRVRATFKGKLYTQFRTADEKKWCDSQGLTALRGEHTPGLGRDMLHFNANSGAQAINLAYLLGATRIVLLGYDMGATGGRNHWFGDHPRGFNSGKYENYVSHFNRLASDLEREGVEVINCTRQTNLTQFKRADIEAVL